MKCRQAQELIGAYLYGDLAADEMRDLRVHAQECAICREDLAGRGRIVSSLDDNVPMLSDEERLRIAWSVKGALRKEQLQRRPLALRLIPTFTITGLLVAGIFVGRYMITRHGHQSPANAIAKNAPHVRVKELPPPQVDKDTNQITDQVSQLLQALSNPNYGAVAPNRSTSPDRSFPPVHRSMFLPDGGLKVVPEQQGPVKPVQPVVPDANSADSPKDSTPAVTKTDSGAGSEAMKLPKVTDPKNAETTPSDNK